MCLAIGAIGAGPLSELSEPYRNAIGAIGAFQIVEERVTAAFHYRSYRRGHYRTIGEGTIGLSELSDCYRTTIGVYYRNYRTGAQVPPGKRFPQLLGRKSRGSGKGHLFSLG